MPEKRIVDPDTKEELPSLATINYWMDFVRRQVGADIEMLVPPQRDEATKSFEACLRLAEREHLRLQNEQR